MSAKKRPKELEYIGKVPKPGDSVWNIQNGYALEHIITDVYSPEGFFSYEHCAAETPPFRAGEEPRSSILEKILLFR